MIFGYKSLCKLIKSLYRVQFDQRFVVEMIKQHIQALLGVFDLRSVGSRRLGYDALHLIA